MKLLVDGDILVYRAGFAADVTLYEVYTDDIQEKPDAKPVFTSTSSKLVKGYINHTLPSKYWDSVTVSRRPAQGTEAAALGNCKDLILTSIVDELGTEDMTIYLSGSNNFREEVATYAKYKGNRDKQRRPLHYDSIKAYLRRTWGAITTEGEEADDAMGQAQAENTVICSIDKDLLQIPGQHFNFVKKFAMNVHPDDAYRLFCKQVLTGDTTDNVLGLPGVGDKTADKILQGSPSRWWDIIINEYRTRLRKKPLPSMEPSAKGVTYPHWDTGMPVFKEYGEYAEEVAQLVWIRRRGQVNAPTR